MLVGTVEYSSITSRIPAAQFVLIRKISYYKCPKLFNNVMSSFLLKGLFSTRPSAMILCIFFACREPLKISFFFLFQASTQVPFKKFFNELGTFFDTTAREIERGSRDWIVTLSTFSMSEIRIFVAGLKSLFLQLFGLGQTVNKFFRMFFSCASLKQIS